MVITLPFSYAFPLADPRYGVVISTPFTYVETDGTQSFALSFTGGLRVPVYDNWTITPSLSIGAAGLSKSGYCKFYGWRGRSFQLSLVSPKLELRIGQHGRV